MTDLLYKIVSAIGTHEGYFVPGSRAERNHNPGNIETAPSSLIGQRKKDPRFAIFKSKSEGIAALYHQVIRHVLRGMSLKQLIHTWAPPHENDTERYVSETARRVGVDPDKPLMDYLVIDRIK